MTRPDLFILCNALADDVRIDRGITTDSPAATRKVAMMANIIRLTGVRTRILSLGRGRQDGSARYFRSRVGRIRGVPTIYGPLLHRPILSELLSFWAPMPALWHQRRRARTTLLLIYNRMPAYLPAIWFARLLGYRLALDLEDGETVLQGWSRNALKARALTLLTDRACTSGALLACRALSDATHLQPQLAYYGVVAPTVPAPRFKERNINLLLGGTVAPSTGADLLARAITALRDRDEAWSRSLHLHVTGTGESLSSFDHLAATNGRGPVVTVHGRLDSIGYEELLTKMDVGLALKPNSGALAHTTFPSKVVEMANAGLLVLSTDISDVREVLGDGAIYLEQDNSDLLIKHLRTIVENPQYAAVIAQGGTQAATARCAPDQAGAALRRFLFPEFA
jgi:glycosyltransferase involved in cell wall biosynthesis